MNLLLDTHTFIWWDSDPARLSSAALATLKDPGNVMFLSVVSVWEIVIKKQLARLTLNSPLATILTQQQANGIQILSISLDHVLEVENLPTPHKDPFDRLLVAQANVEQATLVTVDPIFAKYPVKILW